MLGSVVDRYECEQYDTVTVAAGAGANVIPLGGVANSSRGEEFRGLVDNIMANNSIDNAVNTRTANDGRFTSDIQCRLAVITTTTLAASLVQVRYILLCSYSLSLAL